MDQKKENEQIASLKKMRDELSLQAHLFTMEMKKEWERLEKLWHQLQADLHPITESVSEARQARKDSIRKVAQSLGEAYERLRSHRKAAS